jgi:hypothetical protein
MAYRLGCVLYWVFLVLAGLYVALWLWLALADTHELWREFQSFIFLSLPAALLYGVGRAFRYVLSNE